MTGFVSSFVILVHYRGAPHSCHTVTLSHFAPHAGKRHRESKVRVCQRFCKKNSYYSCICSIFLKRRVAASSPSLPFRRKHPEPQGGPTYATNDASLASEGHVLTRLTTHSYPWKDASFGHFTKAEFFGKNIE